MKSNFVILLVVCSAFLFSFSGISQLDSGAKIEFKKEVHDYGNVKFEGNGSCIFKFKNTGNAPLIISDVVRSCGCTIPSWPKEPIPPGATGEIKVTYDTKRPGAINKNITIVSNATNEPSKILRIKGNVLPATQEK